MRREMLWRGDVQRRPRARARRVPLLDIRVRLVVPPTASAAAGIVALMLALRSRRRCPPDRAETVVVGVVRVGVIYLRTGVGVMRVGGNVTRAAAGGYECCCSCCWS